MLILTFCLSILGCNEKTKKKALNTNVKPNVLFVYIDDLKPELGCYGKLNVKSPNIDKLAKEGILFKRAYVQNPVCGASRASTLSGLRPNKNRFIDYKTAVDNDAPGVITLPQQFKENGYYTVSNGKVFHNLKDTEDRSWSEPAWESKLNTRIPLDPESLKLKGGTKNRGPFFESPDVPDNAYADGNMIEKSIADLKRLSKKKQPFFLAVGIKKPHLPFYAPKKYWDLYVHDSITLPNNAYLPKNAPKGLIGSPEIGFYHDKNMTYNSDEFSRSARHGYYACVSYADALFGKLMKEVEDLGLKDNTIIVLVGDHGWNLGEHTFWSKHNTTHLAMNTPVIISAPGFKGNIKTSGLIEFIDIYPTLCELAEINKPTHLEGNSFKSLMENPNQKWKEKVFSRHKKAVSVITDQYTFTRFSGETPSEMMLYDLKTDPDENVNIAGDKAYQDVVLKMNTYLNESGIYSEFY